MTHLNLIDKLLKFIFVTSTASLVVLILLCGFAQVKSFSDFKYVFHLEQQALDYIQIVQK